MDKQLRVFEAFAGYGSQSMALERLRKSHPGFDYQVVGISEIDMHAVAAYNRSLSSYSIPTPSKQ